MKRILALAAALLIVLSGCAAKEEIKTDNEETSTAMSEIKLTPEQLISAAGLKEEDYAGKNLAAFIDEFEISAETVKHYNIPLLLSYYEPEQDGNRVSGIFDKKDSLRKDNFTADVAAVAFYENVSAGFRSVYYDFKNGKKYSSDREYIFDDLSRYDSADFDDADKKLLSGLEKNGVFGWTSKTSAEGISDPQTMKLVVEYSDGSVFTVYASGILSKLLPGSYGAVKALLLS